MAAPQNIPYGTPPQHPQVANLQADAGVAPLPPAQTYGSYSTSPQNQPAYSPGPQSSYTPNGLPPAPSPYQQPQTQYGGQRPQQYGPYSTAQPPRPEYQSQGSGYFPPANQYQSQQGTYGPSTSAPTAGASTLHPAHAAEGGFVPQSPRQRRHGSYSSTASHNSHRSHNDRRMSHGGHGQDHPSPVAQARRASYANDSGYSHHRKHRDDYDDDDSVFSSGSEDEYDHSGRRHSHAGDRSAYSHSARKRRGSHRSEAEIQADKDAIDRRPTLGDSVLLMYDTFKGAITGKRN